MKRDIPRRDFLKHGALAGAAALVLPAPAGARSELGRADAPRRVVVLGAGLAGLAAGYELARAGHEVKVLEAQGRPGGRVLTLRTFDEGLYGDAGAARIPAGHQARGHGRDAAGRLRRLRDSLRGARPRRVLAAPLRGEDARARRDGLRDGRARR